MWRSTTLLRKYGCNYSSYWLGPYFLAPRMEKHGYKPQIDRREYRAIEFLIDIYYNAWNITG